MVPEKKHRPKLTTYTTQEKYNYFAEWAKEEGRTISNLLDRILDAAIVQREKKISANVLPKDLDASALLKLLAADTRPSDEQIREIAANEGIDAEVLLLLRDRLFKH
ncbi:hypothetical protein [Brasilonema sp. UFV-L1]|uniref:hypothetical protein n=1 Tax=Brasilonema sp. UFV-L1 TaxID=2234130 RepID=UPI00145E26B0|nr:hypothetical protein [Brasilonema sp. UFV-L1]NMG10361.1 hypothetical protein [Brasilonema sp. UFV-L1]